MTYEPQYHPTVKGEEVVTSVAPPKKQHCKNIFSKSVKAKKADMKWTSGALLPSLYANRTSGHKKVVGCKSCDGMSGSAPYLSHSCDQSWSGADGRRSSCFVMVEHQFTGSLGKATIEYGHINDEVKPLIGRRYSYATFFRHLVRWQQRVAKPPRPSSTRG